MSFSTPGIRQDHDPARWRQHRFGVPADRWRALAGRNFWVTGGGTGFGHCIAGGLAAAGARVVMSGRRREKLDESVDALRRLDIDTTSVIPMPLDITDPPKVGVTVDAIARQRGALHGLVHCAALPQPPAGPWPLMDMSPDQWDRMLRTNVTGAWLITRAALKLMAQNGGRILYLTSEAGWASTAGFGAYNVSKSALNALSASAAAECAARYPTADFQVNALVPGEALTEMNRGSSDSAWSVVSAALLLLSHPPGGPTGRFFHRDGRHLRFAYAAPYGRSLLTTEALIPIPLDTPEADKLARPAQDTDIGAAELITSLHGYNIVHLKGRFYSVPQRLGELDVAYALMRGTPEIVPWPSLAAARDGVVRVLGASQPNLIRRVARRVRQITR